jgi:hypothetical protein
MRTSVVACPSNERGNTIWSLAASYLGSNISSGMIYPFGRIVGPRYATVNVKVPWPATHAVFFLGCASNRRNAAPYFEILLSCGGPSSALVRHLDYSIFFGSLSFWSGVLDCLMQTWDPNSLSLFVAKFLIISSIVSSWGGPEGTNIFSVIRSSS